MQGYTRVCPGGQSTLKLTCANFLSTVLHANVKRTFWHVQVYTGYFWFCVMYFFLALVVTQIMMVFPPLGQPRSTWAAWAKVGAACSDAFANSHDSLSELPLSSSAPVHGWEPSRSRQEMCTSSLARPHQISAAGYAQTLLWCAGPHLAKPDRLHVRGARVHRQCFAIPRRRGSRRALSSSLSHSVTHMRYSLGQ